ncbi:phage head closure protein [Bacillus mesophilum]|uniref:Phage head closure protein n=1 Tax=Bacillus mesophilum TaxID=1071718 RepID=A0A7V7RNV3_9BACI|nr:phage head closure protein [Bacillus mesophilum]KAB2334261.1 phage head closure protein [Bacillus mesophilum]
MPSIKSSLGNNEHISLDDVCFLITKTSNEDELGQRVPETEKERQIFCSKTSVSRAEFLAAGQLDHKPQLTIIVDSDEYDGEIHLRYGTKKYSIYRVFVRSDGFTELYCEVHAG